jgi:hypothetical protein
MIWVLASGGCSRNAQEQAPKNAVPEALRAQLQPGPEVRERAPVAASPQEKHAPSEPQATRAPEPTPQEQPAAGEAVYLESFSAADVARAAARSGAAETRVTWRIRPWSARADTLLALSFVALDADATLTNAAQLKPELAVLEKQGNTLQRLAAGVVPIDAEGCVCDAAQGCGEAPTVDFDLARYRIAVGREAFGVRLTCHWTAAAAEGDSTRLTLFEPEAGQLRELFTSEVSSSTGDRVCGCTFSSDATLQILSSQHDGFYDLRLRTLHRKTPFFDDVPLTEPAPGPTVQRFTWNGARYSEAPAKPGP